MIRRRKILPVMIPVASMADIAFLLIIFFMLTSNFIRNKNIEMTKPDSSDIVRAEEAPVTVTMDRLGVIRLNGQVVDVGLLDFGIRALLADVKDKRVMVQIDKDLLKEQFMPLLSAVASADVQMVLGGDFVHEF